MRAVQVTAPDPPDNQGHIISHVGLNNDTRWSEFRELDFDDQYLVHAWVTGETNGDGDSDDARGPRARRFDGGMRLDNEILTDCVEHTYLDPTDDCVLDELLAPGIKLGDLTDREQLRTRLLTQRAAAPSPSPEPIPVSPSRRQYNSAIPIRRMNSSVNETVGKGTVI
jgi:DNA repair protein RadD